MNTIRSQLAIFITGLLIGEIHRIYEDKKNKKVIKDLKKQIEVSGGGIVLSEIEKECLISLTQGPVIVPDTTEEATILAYRSLVGFNLAYYSPIYRYSISPQGEQRIRKNAS